MTREREEFLIGEIKKDWRYLGKISKEEQTDRVIDLAMDIDAFAFRLIKDEKKKTFERCLKAVKCVKVVKCYSMIIDRVPNKLKKRVMEEFLIGEIKKDWRYLGKISKEEQTDRVIDLAMDIDAFAFWHIKDYKKKTFERCLKAVKCYSVLIDRVPDELKESVLEEVEIDI